MKHPYRSTSGALISMLLLAAWSSVGAGDEILANEKLTPTAFFSAGRFGSAVAVFEDTMVVTAPLADVGEFSEAGLVYVFKRTLDGQWLPVQEFSANQPVAGLQLGYSVALTADTLVVGAPEAGGDDSGAVFVYQLDDDGNWEERGVLTDPSDEVATRFGVSVALSASELLVGASIGGSIEQGKVVRFIREANEPQNWPLGSPIVDTNGKYLDRFGGALALDGSRLLVGATFVDVCPPDPPCWPRDQGAVFLFEKQAGDWSFVDRLEASQGAQLDLFGTSVALDGTRALIGAPNHKPDGSTRAGAVFVFEPAEDDQSQWRQVGRIRTDELQRNAAFGAAILWAGADVVVGAPGASVGDKRTQGAVYVFRPLPPSGDPEQARTWLQQARVIAGDGLESSEFGIALAIAGEEVLIGANSEGEGRGAVYLHPGEPIALVSEPEQPLYPATAELENAAVVESVYGLMVGALDGALAEPLPVWIREVAAPDHDLPAGADVVERFYNVGAHETVYAPDDSGFVIALPVPELANANHLVAAVLTSQHLYPIQPDVTQDALDQFWALLPGTLDAENGLYSIYVPAIDHRGATVALVEHPDFGPLPPMMERDIGDPAPLVPPSPVFKVECIGHNLLGSTCTSTDEDRVAQDMDAFYRMLKAEGFPDPAMNRNRTVTFHSGPTPHFTVQGSYPFIGVHLLPTISPFCLLTNARALYHGLAMNIQVCYESSLTDDQLYGAVRHELFHGVENAYRWIPHPLWNAHLLWLLEGMAEAAANSTPQLQRDRARSPRAMHIPMMEGAGLWPYRAQDFWVFFGRSRNLTMGYFKDVLTAGFEGPQISSALASQSNGLTLGDAYWQWAKDHVFEHTTPPIGHVFGQCEYSAALAPPNARSYPTGLQKLELHPQQALRPMQSIVHMIRFSSGVNPDSGPPIEVTVTEKGGAGNLSYKVYGHGATDCLAVDDGQRSIDELLLSPDNQYAIQILIANKSTKPKHHVHYRLVVEYGE